MEELLIQYETLVSGAVGTPTPTLAKRIPSRSEVFADALMRMHQTLVSAYNAGAGPDQLADNARELVAAAAAAANAAPQPSTDDGNAQPIARAIGVAAEVRRIERDIIDMIPDNCDHDCFRFPGCKYRVERSRRTREIAQDQKSQIARLSNAVAARFFGDRFPLCLSPDELVRAARGIDPQARCEEVVGDWRIVADQWSRQKRQQNERV